MKKVKQNKKGGFIERLAGDYDIPPELLHGGCFVEIRGRNSVTVRGCRRIIKYCTEKVILKMCRDILEVTGKRLTCLTYFSGAVVIEGLIEGLNFQRSDVAEVGDET